VYLFTYVIRYLFMTEKEKDTLKLIAWQTAATILVLPTAGMSLAVNLITLDNYHRKWYPFTPESEK